VHLERDVHLVRYEPGRLEFRSGPQAPSDLSARVAKCLNDWTGMRWAVMTSASAGDPTLFEQTMTGVRAHPLVQATLKAFPSAGIGAIRDLESTDGGDAIGALIEPVIIPDPDELPDFD
jgi:DNA polymerase-3 subunit gamma/tau